MNHLYELLKIEALEINHFFQKACLEGKGTPQEVSDRRETAVKRFLEKYFPFPYRIAKGNIRDSYGNSSSSIDCIILNPAHPYTVSDDEKYSIILADGVDVAIEVKPDFSSEKEVQRSLRQIASVKKLTRKKHGVLLENRLAEGQIAGYKKIPTFIFGNKTYKDIRTLITKIVNFYLAENIPRNEQFDFIIINDNCIIFNSKKDSYFYLNNSTEGIFFIESKEMTIANFLFWLNQLPQSSPKISSSVLEHYLKFEPENLKTFHDLNSLLLN